MTVLKDVVSFLDQLLDPSGFQDASNNGLQVENSGRADMICSGVDASYEFLEIAAQKKAGMVFCHHGISWGDSLNTITGINYKKIKFLLDNDIALYASHLPLDAHPECGNNALICGALGLGGIKPFGSVGFSGSLLKPVPLIEFKEKAKRVFGQVASSMDFGKKEVKTVAVASGGGAGEIGEAVKSGFDVFLSGEPKLSAYNTAKECGINAIFAGHYKTETFGVKKISEILSENFPAATEFIDMDISY